MNVAEAQTANQALPASDKPSFRTEVLVRFADCDPAGIVFYPRFLEMFNNLVEDWCRDGLKFSFDEIVIKRGWGLPTVHLEADFIAPCRLGEVLTAKLFVRSMGTSSINADICLSGPDQERARARKSCSGVDGQEFRPGDGIPRGLRKRYLDICYVRLS